MADIKVSETVKVYKGSEGLRVAVLNLLPKEERRALVEIEGVDSDIAGIVLPHSVSPSNQDLRMKTTLEGEPFVTLARQSSSWGYSGAIRLHLPDHAGSFEVAYHEEESKRVRAEDVLNRHLRQLGDGTLSRLQAYDRTARIDRARKALAEDAKEVEKLTGAPLPFEVKWETVSDDLFREISVASFLGIPYSGLRRLCSRSENGEHFRKAIASRIKKVVVGMAPDRMRISLDADGILHWTTARDESNQDDFAMYCLQNIL